jgi:hypothetical protein
MSQKSQRREDSVGASADVGHADKRVRSEIKIKLTDIGDLPLLTILLALPNESGLALALTCKRTARLLPPFFVALVERETSDVFEFRARVPAPQRERVGRDLFRLFAGERESCRVDRGERVALEVSCTPNDRGIAPGASKMHGCGWVLRSMLDDVLPLVRAEEDRFVPLLQLCLSQFAAYDLGCQLPACVLGSTLWVFSGQGGRQLRIFIRNTSGCTDDDYAALRDGDDDDVLRLDFRMTRGPSSSAFLEETDEELFNGVIGGLKTAWMKRHLRSYSDDDGDDDGDDDEDDDDDDDDDGCNIFVESEDLDKGRFERDHVLLLSLFGDEWRMQFNALTIAIPRALQVADPGKIVIMRND